MHNVSVPESLMPPPSSCPGMLKRLQNYTLTQGQLVNGTPSTTSSGINSPALSETSRWVVQKFGGTSVGKFPDNIANVVKNALADNRAAVVCSTRSSTVKSEGTTNRLLRCAHEAQDLATSNFVALLEDVRLDHIKAAETYIKTPDILSRLREEIEEECLHISRFLEAAQVLGEVSHKSRDKVMSAGEKLACRFLTAVLQEHGVDAGYVDLAEVVSFPLSEGIDQRFYDQVAFAIADELSKCTAAVPVITGFFGSVPGGLLDTVGRGYTDLCAALVAVGLHAKELQIWKEVDGIFTADPRKVPTAVLLPYISPAEAAELTFYGSEVIHPFTMEQVMRAHTPIRIKNVMNPRAAGTLILPDSETVGPAAASLASTTSMFRSRSSLHLAEKRPPKRPTAVTIKHKILVINIHSNRRSLSHGFYFKIFAVLNKWRMSIDLISTSEVHVSMALHSEAPLYDGGGDDEFHIIDQDFKGAVEELSDYGKVDIIPEMAIVSLVGKDMKNMVGIAGKMFSTLGENNVNIEMISQGASEINISCVIEERDADRALNILHTSLFTFLEQ